MSEAWRLPFRSAVLAVGAGPDGHHVTDEAGLVHQVAVDGTWRWMAQLPARGTVRPLALGSVVVVGCANGEVVGLDARTSRTTFRTAVSGPVSTDPVWAGVVLVGDESGVVTAIGHDGTPRWMLPTGSAVRAPITLTGDSVLIAATDGRVYRVAAGTGVPAWAFPAPAPVTAAPVIAGGLAIVACTDGTTFGVDLQTGQARWGAQLAGGVDGAPVVRGRTVVVADRSGHVTALGLDAGAPAWRTEVGGPLPTGVVDHGPLVVLDSGDGRLLALEPGSGRVVAEHRVSAGSRPGLATCPGEVLVAEGPVLRSLRVRA